MKQILVLPGSLFRKLHDSPFTALAAARPWRAGMVLAFLAWFFAFPSYDVALVLHEMDDTWKAIFRQAAAPFTDHSALYDPESHSSKLAFRFVPALLLNALGVHSIIGAFVVQLCLLGVFYWLLFKLFSQLTAQPRTAFLLALPICFMIAGHVTASDYRGIFDILALCLLLAAALLRCTAWVIPLILLAGFTDERALMATPALILFDLYLSGHHTSRTAILERLRSEPIIMVFVSWAFYFIVRSTLGRVFGLHTASVDVLHYFGTNIPNIPYGLYIGLEAHYLVATTIVVLLFRRGAVVFLVLLLGSWAVLQFFALCVVDINRSLSYLILWIVLTWFILFRERPLATTLNLAAWVTLLNLVYDDFYPLPLQLIRMAFVSQTLLPLDGWSLN